MAVDVLAIVKKYLASDGKSISITPDISSVFGPAIGNAVTQLFSGGINVNGANFSLTGDSAVATISGEGSKAPLVQSVKVVAVFTATENDVTLNFTGTLQSTVLLSDAWPSQLNFFPFNQLALTGGGLKLDVDPGATTIDMVVTPTISFENNPLGTGLLEVSYDGATLGFVGGFMVTGSWTPFSDFPVLSGLTISGEFGAFFASVDATDLSAFSGFPFPPEEVSAGLTVIGLLELDGALSPIKDFLPDTKLELTAIVPKDGGLSKASVKADLSEGASTNAFAFNDFSLEWQSTSADSGSISLSVTCTVNISSKESFVITGAGTFIYGTTPSLELSLQLTAEGGWLHPFGIPNLTIQTVAFAFTLNEEGIGIAMAGTIEIGTGQTNPVLLTAGAGFLDFEVPDYVAAELSAEQKDQSVTLGQLITDFLPVLDFNSFPLLKDITFKDLQFWAIANTVKILGKTYNPGIGCSGEISFFGYTLDFGFNLITSPTTAVQAMGIISYNGGPIVISGGGITWLTISSADGTSGASACIDTSGSGYCNSIASQPGAYFAINAKVTLLGLVGVSIVALATKDVFEFDMDLGAGGIFSEQIHVLFQPSSGGFAGSLDADFSPPDITLGPWGVIPQFTIPTPKLSVCLGLGTIVPSSPICQDQYMPTSAPYFHFDLHFSFVGIDFDLTVSLDVNQVTNALSDFGSFIVNWLANNAKLVLDFILQSAELLTKLLLQIIEGIVDLVSYVAGLVAQQLGILFEDAYKLAGEIWDGLQEACAVVTGNDAMGASSSMVTATGHMTAMAAVPSGIHPAVHTVPAVLSDLMNTPKGDALLFHYYSHREEAERILRYNTNVRLVSDDILRMYRGTPEFAAGKYLPLAIDIIRTTAAAASPDFQASAKEVIEGLEPYRDKTYDELLEIIHAK
ncbi:hypothetical protein [Occallatibacter riparius]|uniref:Uncharacterized protein n=1 Tax=Occallatibacter riparius TaxID=1002689 RepID=A0A9J7BX62_9BACT|nr:hypothetical protein [Occallatibacter riparius]UWZ85518.1 hypothetical protein MOP44_06145 [Occallatibacter riparius]